MLRAKPFLVSLGCLALLVIIFNTLSVVHLVQFERTLRQGDTPPRYTPRKLHVVTLADDPRPEICLVAAAVHATGHQLQVLAWNHSTNFFDNTSCGAQCGANTANDFRIGQQKKTHWLHHYVASHPDLHDDDLLLYTDAYDVVVQMPMDVLTQRFLRQTKGQRGILFNAEPTCGDSFTLGGDYGDHLRAASFDVRLNTSSPTRSVRGLDMCDEIRARSIATSFGTGPNLFLGSGGILGDVRSVRAYLRRVKQVHKMQQDAYDAGTSPFFFYGDQISFQLAYVQFPELNAQVDRDGDIFFVVSSSVAHGTFEHLTPHSGCAPSYFVNGSASILTWSGSAPIFFHFPGGFKFMYESCARAVTTHLVQTAKQPPIIN
ncbi:hypothetical protein SDRG_03764 [Saprolegnia diclina VS20]|uniref:Nucleotide-diphospho-sugar transferase domain-containing protein n=1 Tax=Saprolegnia diclina (strain VS20) TaxID=1156394 RepID=T0QXK7_SAPDV|nr:hypothetical protein SDRG_03764 [Saprolegnia diclina VS20]EQC38805.1 hypothetical protein SDRG_03764 [Saprolegnia diclina VS20]|eukprot:XP_008607629.1 hypothetical protein SDRG_03764 [Saprolegnia diclina VS20]